MFINLQPASEQINRARYGNQIDRVASPFSQEVGPGAAQLIEPAECDTERLCSREDLMNDLLVAGYSWSDLRSLSQLHFARYRKDGRGRSTRQMFCKSSFDVVA
jgi:hypothetical protein